MTTTPDRIIRAKAQSRSPSHFAPTERQRERHERIVDITQYLLAEEGFHNITFRGLACGLRLTTATSASWPPPSAPTNPPTPSATKSAAPPTWPTPAPL